MDPDVALAEIREALERIAENSTSPYWRSYAYLRVAERVAALDEWISKGGFLPAAWNHAKEAK